MMDRNMQLGFLQTQCHKMASINDNSNNKSKALREHKPPSTPKFETKVIWDSNPDFQINPVPDPDVHQICPKMLWTHYLISVSHFAKYGTNWPLIV